MPAQTLAPALPSNSADGYACRRDSGDMLVIYPRARQAWQMPYAKKKSRARFPDGHRNVLVPNQPTPGARTACLSTTKSWINEIHGPTSVGVPG